jgi:hypothetical protein
VSIKCDDDIAAAEWHQKPRDRFRKKPLVALN